MQIQPAQKATRPICDVRFQDHMGLAQNIFFEYNSRREVENFLEDFCKDFQSHKEGDLFVIASSGETAYRFEMAIEDYGLYTHQSGQYFEILGNLVERLTAKFGKIKIDDI